MERMKESGQRWRELHAPIPRRVWTLHDWSVMAGTPGKPYDGYVVYFLRTYSNAWEYAYSDGVAIMRSAWQTATGIEQLWTRRYVLALPGGPVRRWTDEPGNVGVYQSWTDSFMPDETDMNTYDWYMWRKA